MNVKIEYKNNVLTKIGGLTGRCQCSSPRIHSKSKFKKQKVTQLMIG